MKAEKNVVFKKGREKKGGEGEGEWGDEKVG